MRSLSAKAERPHHGTVQYPSRDQVMWGVQAWRGVRQGSEPGWVGPHDDDMYMTPKGVPAYSRSA